jgi:hypothetical protein
VGLQPGLPFPSHSSSQEGGQEVGDVQGDVFPSHPILGRPDMVRLSQSAGRGRRSLSPDERQPRHRPHDRLISSNSGQALPCRLDDFRRCRGIDSISDRSVHLVEAGWKRSSAERYERAWQSFKDFFHPSSIPFHQASLKDVMDYLAHLYNCKLSWSTIGIHRSAILMTLAPIDGVLVGEHPIVKRLMGRAFNERPPRWDAPTLWDPQGF